MRQFTTNEQRLLILFCSGIFLAINLLAFHTWTSRRARVAHELSLIRSQIAEDQSWIERAAAMDSAREWMASHPPPQSTADQASTALLQTLRKSAEGAGLKIIKETLLPSASTTTIGNATSLQVSLSGAFAGVAQLLFSLQSPTAWRSVPQLLIRSDTEPPNVLVDIEICQYYVQP